MNKFYLERFAASHVGSHYKQLQQILQLIKHMQYFIWPGKFNAGGIFLFVGSIKMFLAAPKAECGRWWLTCYIFLAPLLSSIKQFDTRYTYMLFIHAIQSRLRDCNLQHAKLVNLNQRHWAGSPVSLQEAQPRRGSALQKAQPCRRSACKQLSHDMGRPTRISKSQSAKLSRDQQRRDVTCGARRRPVVMDTKFSSTLFCSRISEERRRCIRVNLGAAVYDTCRQGVRFDAF